MIFEQQKHMLKLMEMEKNYSQFYAKNELILRYAMVT